MNHKTVLLVDDDVDFTEVNRITLENAGYKVVVAHSGDDGFLKAVEGGVDVAVLDVMMASPTEGFELARRMRKDARTARIPLLMLTAINAVDATQGYKFRFSEKDIDEYWLPVDRFFDKPIKADRLLGLVQDLAS